MSAYPASVPALIDVSLSIKAGEYVAVMGPGASGKSTLAKVMDGIYLPDSGDCLVDRVSTRDDRMRARRLVGLVLQEPDDQAVARRVEDDLAFGPRNIGAAISGESRKRCCRRASGTSGEISAASPADETTGSHRRRPGMRRRAWSWTNPRRCWTAMANG
jgi:energy-coupling factor transporter ATP-binding protein EcfA2